MAGMPPVLLGVFDHCKIPSTQIRDVISNHRQWVLLKVSPAGLALCGSMQQKGQLMHFLSCSYSASLVQRVLHFILSNARVHQHCYKPSNYKSEPGAHLRGKGSIHKRLLLLGTLLGGENWYLCAVPPPLTLNLCLNRPTWSRLKPFLDQSLKCSE